MVEAQHSIIVTGGAGYVGSHIAWLLAQQGYHVIIIDNFIHNQHFNPAWATVYRNDFADIEVLKELFTKHYVSAVIHCAGFIEVGQSVKDPALFYENNVAKTIALLQTMMAYGIKHFIFSSSCAVYGNPEHIPMTEEHPQKPLSPYGKTKAMVEALLPDFAQAYGLKYVSLRYFNVAGAFPEEGLGECHTPETHIIPLLLDAALEQKPFTLFGNDYATKDGTPVRDYVHVRDIAQAHILALHHLLKGLPSEVFNIGIGHGYTVKELVSAVQEVCRAPITTSVQKRRQGDAPILLADATRARTILQWQPLYSELSFILKSAHAFYIVQKIKHEKELRYQQQQ